MRTIVEKRIPRWTTMHFFVNDIKVGEIEIESNLRCPTTLKLWNFGIHEGFRSKGYGTQAIKKVINKFPKFDLWLHVDRTNKTAIKIYEKVGFRKVKGFNKSTTFYMVRPSDEYLKSVHNKR